MRVTRPNMLTSTILLSFILLLASSVEAQVFTPGGRYATGTSPQTMVVADLDNDGDLDLAINQTDEDVVYIHLNDGYGDFSDFHTVVAARDGGLYAADFNNDGYNDLLLYDEWWLYDTWGTTVYLNNGDATFDLFFQDTLGSPDLGLAPADYNGDNLMDIAVFSYLEAGGIWIFFNTGAGNFAPAVLIQPETYSYTDLRACDVDNDGDTDILYYNGATFCLLNDGTGAFDEPLSTGSGFGEFADMNGDEYPDLISTAIYGCSHYPSYRIGNGDGTFGSASAAWITAGRLSGIRFEAADFNSDGFTDIAIAGPDTNKVEVGLNDGRLWFREFVYITAGVTGLRRMEHGDFDGDGDIDLAMIGSDDTLTVAFSRGAQHSNRILVPDDVPTIQGAVDYAWNLDEIIVEPGTYVENIDFGGKNLVLVSSDYADKGMTNTTAEWTKLSEATILDGGGTGRVLTFDDFEDDRALVAGFTIQNGNAGMGGGIYCYDTAAPTIIHNIIKDNYATAAGGGIFLHNGESTVRNNLIINNSSGNWGGGIYAGTGTVVCNTIYGNTAEAGGGGLYYNYGTPTICNNILWGNSSTVGGQQIAHLTNPPPSVAYCNVQDGWTGEGNIDQDPMFVDPANGDFTLMPGSPCIDAGDPSLPNDPDGTTADMGAFAYFNPMDAQDGTDESERPETFTLAQNYPNPFNPTTTIAYSLPERSHISIEVFNVLGQRVRTLIDREQPAGTYTIIWDGADDRGTALATGVYLYRFRAGDYIETRKMLLMK